MSNNYENFEHFVGTLKKLESNLDINFMRSVYQEANLALEDTHTTYNALEQKTMLLLTIFLAASAILLNFVKIWSINHVLICIVLIILMFILCLAIKIRNYAPLGTTPSNAFEKGQTNEMLFLARKIYNLDEAIIKNRKNNKNKLFFIILSFYIAVISVIIESVVTIMSSTHYHFF